jgi:hypothetical protein
LFPFPLLIDFLAFFAYIRSTEGRVQVSIGAATQQKGAETAHLLAASLILLN